ncbi:MAG: potassium transporter TrkG, partial [Nitrososphaeraceae archaeon]
DVLTRPITSYVHGQFVQVEENTTVTSAVNLLLSKNAKTVIVSSKEGKSVGIVTDTDILDKVVGRGEDSDFIYLKSIMTSPIITIPSSATVREAIELMRSNKIKRLPVVTESKDNDNSKILGIVTQESLAYAVRQSVIEKTFRPYRTYRIMVIQGYKPIIGNLGFLMQFAGVLMIVPAVLGAVLGETSSATGIFLSFVAMSFTGFVLNAYGEKTPMNLRQTSIVMVLSFVLLSLFGSLPFMYVNPFLKEGNLENIDPLSLFVNSFFESASGFTTTGMSTIFHPEELPESFVFYRAYILLIGGLSFVYLVIALFYPKRRLAAMKNMMEGASILKLDQLIITITVIFSVYSVVLIFIIYLLGEIDIIYSASLIFAAITGGGFVPLSSFLVVDNQLQLMVLIVGMIISALPFAFHYGVFSRQVKARKVGLEIFVFGMIMISSVPILVLLEPNLGKSNWFASVFHIVSASTTTGFQFLDLSAFTNESKILLILLMFIGGSAFSTAGGIKVARLIFIFQKLFHRRKSTSKISSTGGNTSTTTTTTPSITSSRTIQMNNLSYDSHLEQKKHFLNTKEGRLNTVKILLSEKTFREALLVIALFIVLSLISGITIKYLTNSSFIDAIFESVSAISNTGLSTGITNVGLDSISKSILILNMILGRFEIVTVLYIFFGILRR